MPGTLATNGFVAIGDGATCCRVYAGSPIVVGDATLFKVCLSNNSWGNEWVGVSRGQGGDLSFADIG